jgi:PhoPQ-activated pathogenicity-related protein
MRSILVKAVLFALCIGVAVVDGSTYAHARKGSTRTALDDYVAAPDDTYSYEVKGSFVDPADQYNVVVIRLTSQQWLTAAESDSSIWKHWLMICIPNKVKYATSLMWVDGGHTNDAQPTSLNPIVEQICLRSESIVAELHQIPNEPVQFFNDGVERSEDAFIAYTWSHFLNDTSDPYWLARLPMTKAVVRAMDTVQDFVNNRWNKVTTKPVPALSNFLVAGASKRGWTTWTTAVVDSRVIGIAPLVIPVLQLVPNCNHQYMCYGEWSFAFNDYIEMGVMGYLNQPEFQMLADIVDPYSYLDRLTMPKYVICSLGDEFFLPDDPQFFFKDLQGEKSLRMVPNAEHSLIGHELDIGYAIETWGYMLMNNIRRPTATWTLHKSNTTARIVVRSEDKPTSVILYHANTISATMRDFRLAVCEDIANCIQPIYWFSRNITEEFGEDGKTWVVEHRAPTSGWTGFMVELQWDFTDYSNPLGPEHIFKITTEVNVVPDILPFPSCGDNCQPTLD